MVFNIQLYIVNFRILYLHISSFYHKKFRIPANFILCYSLLNYI
nr:MAG TPA: hypothetical protein [Caudoviricetes sp.]